MHNYTIGKFKGGHTSAPVIGLCAATLLISACGSTDSSRRDQEFDGRLYIGAGALVSNLEPDTDDVPAVSVDETQSAGGSLFLGYDISNRFSIEGTFSDLGEAELAVENADDEEITYQTFGISGLLYGLNDRDDRNRREGFSVFGRLGVGGLENDSDIEFDQVNPVHLIAGVGVEYGFRNGLALRGEVVGHDTDARFAQLALLYRFGDAAPRTVKARDPEPQPEPRAAPEPAPAPVEKPVAPVPRDGDNDGVVDASDRCLDTRPGVPVDQTGCDLFGGVIEGVNFESGSDALTQGARIKLDEVAATLASFPDVTIRIDAHTDNSGDANANLDLSRRRAISVARYLVGKGIAGPRLKPRAFGESQPRSSNATSEGRAENRRVEFSIVQ